MFKITPTEALQIQKRQILNYADLYPGKLPALEQVMKKLTNLDGLNLDKEYDIIFINERIPRGEAIERIVFGESYRGD